MAGLRYLGPVISCAVVVAACGTITGLNDLETDPNFKSNGGTAGSAGNAGSAGSGGTGATGGTGGTGAAGGTCGIGGRGRGAPRGCALGFMRTNLSDRLLF